MFSLNPIPQLLSALAPVPCLYLDVRGSRITFGTQSASALLFSHFLVATVFTETSLGGMIFPPKGASRFN